MSKKKLTEKDYWETEVESVDEATTSGHRPGLKARLTDRFFGRVKDGYSKYLMYDVHCRRHLPKGSFKALEVGSSPGNELIAVHRKFGYVPYGVEYTDSGVELNRRNFKAHGLDPSQVIHSDFFAEEFQAEYREQFDLVMSHGFIEHFTDLDAVVRSHTNLLKSGGYLLLTVPNFRWLNYLVIRFFSPHAIEAHNLNIMKKSTMLRHVPTDQYDVLVCKFLGTFNCGIIYGPKKSRIKSWLMNGLMRLQELIDAGLYTFFKKGFIESSLFSPKLMLLARKKSPASD